MPWPIPKAKDIAERFAGILEAGILRVRPDADPVAVSRAVRSARGVFAQFGRAVSLALREVHDHQAFWGRQYFVDTAEDEFVLRHADIWGIDQRAAVRAVGRVRIEGVPTTVVPAGLELTASNGVIYETTEAGPIAGNGAVILGARAQAAGPLGNLEMGVRLSTLAAFPAISKVTVSTVFQGGVGEETAAELAAAVQLHIRQRPHGGAAFDYPVWLSRQFAVKAVNVVPAWIGRGSVGLVVAMRNDDGSARVPTGPELDAMQAYIGETSSQTGLKPVTARVVLVAATLRSLALTVRLRPDTAATRAAVAEAWTRFVATIGDADDPQNAGPIGARIEPSRISEALSAASGEYAHDLLIPAAPFTLERTEYPLAGLITWSA